MKHLKRKPAFYFTKKEEDLIHTHGIVYVSNLFAKRFGCHSFAAKSIAWYCKTGKEFYRLDYWEWALDGQMLDFINEKNVKKAKPIST